MSINYDVLYDVFGWNSDLYGLAENVLMRADVDTMDADEIVDEIYQCMDDELIYTSDQWRMMMAYQSPAEANFYEAWETFESDLLEAIAKGVLKGDE